MRTPIAKEFGIELPIFAFSHCRDVVAAVTKAGGMGVLGAAWMTPEELEMSIEWIRKRVDGKPFGVDLVFPGTHGDEKEPLEYLKAIPAEHFEFVKRLLDGAGIEDLPPGDRDEFMAEYATKMAMTNQKSKRQLEIALDNRLNFIVGALGVTPKWVIDAAHARSIKVGALVGSARHAAKQRDAGVDVLVAQGTEAGGSVGDVASMVLWPQVVDEAKGLPVLAAGGVGRGSQILAALALGCQGVWLGSLWLGTAESELDIEMRERLFRAGSEDAALSKAMTGKQGRMLRTKYVDSWEASDAPQYLPWPMQSILGGYPFRRAARGHNLDYWTYSCGQIVGDMREHTTVKGEIERLLNEYVESLERLNATSSWE
jgi:NAD(P)H-dependent flavin oxidoreductase YrpB (nitropropane dioxygenase family)